MAGLPGARGVELLTGNGHLHVGSRAAGPSRHRVRDPVAESESREPRVWRFRDGTDGGAGRLPASWGKREDPLLYVTFGSVTASVGHFGEIYPATLRALADLPVRVLMTTGEGLDPAELEPIPANTRVERWWPQAEVMPLAAAMVGHGGFGTTMTALRAGVPQVVVPLFAFDQFVNADRVAAVGAGVQLLGGAPASDQLPAAVDHLLHDPSYGRAREPLPPRSRRCLTYAAPPRFSQELAGPTGR